ncbi:MAG: hypothetical protein ACFFB3_13170 [Candidatus Hodarchaeota archaeon]
MVIASDWRKNRFLKDDYVRDIEGIIYLVLLNDHPPDSVVVAPKYIPQQGGKWRESYSRIFGNYTSTDFHKAAKLEIFRKYEYYSESFSKKLLAIPHSCIAEHYIPENKLRALASASQNDLSSLEKKATELVNILSEIGIEQRAMGITGSILYNLHMPFSNLSIIFYGLKAAKTYFSKIEELIADYTTLSFKSQTLNLNGKSIALGSRVRTFLWMRGVSTAIHMNEFPDFQFRYGSEFIQNLGNCEITAKIFKVESGFIRKLYTIQPVEIITWPNNKMEPAKSIQLRIFSGRSKDIIFKEGELIKASGFLQKVDNTYEKGSLGSLRLSIGLEENPGFACPFSLIQETL